MSCILRISGENFNLDEFLKASSLKPCAIFRKGEPRFTTKPKGKKISENGVNVIVSNAGFEKIQHQIKEPLTFYKKIKKS